MVRMPETTTITNLKQSQAEVLAKVQSQPLMLIQNGEAIAVVCSTEQWNAMIDELEQLRRNRIADAGFARMVDGEEGKDYFTYTSPEQILALGK